MNILVLDTSTTLSGIALAIDERIVAETLFTSDRNLSNRLVPEIDRLLDQAGLSVNGIDLFACSTGPGSFTGVRCGVATVQGLALATGKPCTGFSSLAMLALNFAFTPYPVCPLLDARKNEVYGALYDCSGTLPFPLIADCVEPVQTLLERIMDTTGSPVILAGEGSLRYRETIAATLKERVLPLPFQHHTCRAANGAFLALDNYRRGLICDAPEQLLPTYIRASEAELAKRARAAAVTG